MSYICPQCGSADVESEETDQTEDGAEIYQCTCRKCGYSWQEET